MFQGLPGQVLVNELFHSHVVNNTRPATIGMWQNDKGLVMKKSVQDCCYNITGANIRIVTIEVSAWYRIASLFALL